MKAKKIYSVLIAAALVLCIPAAYCLPGISVKTSRKDYEIGQNVTVEWEAEELPPNSEIRLFIYPEFQIYQHANLDLSKSELPARNGKGRFEWLSSEAWLNSPAYIYHKANAETALRPEPGNYRVGILVQGRTPVSKQSYLIAEGHSEPFKLRGEVKNLNSLDKAMEMAIMQAFEPLKLYTYSQTRLKERYISIDKLKKKPDGTYSKTAVLLEPFQGKLEAIATDCSDPRIVGKIDYKNNVLSYIQAKAIAEKAVEAKYKAKVRPQLGTSLSVYLQDWCYKQGNVKSPAHWIFKMQAGEVGGSSILKDRLPLNLNYLRVFNDGRCRMTIAPIDPASNRPRLYNIWDDQF